MNDQRIAFSDSETRNPALCGPAVPKPTVLMIGRIPAGARDYLRARNASQIACTLAILDRALLDRVAPQAVSFPLIGPEGDAIQILGLLGPLGFCGEAIIFAPRLPDREMVRRELREAALGLKLTVVELPGG